MFLTNEQADARLNSEKNLARANFIKERTKFPEEPGSPSETENLSESLSIPRNTVTEKVITLPGKNRINLTKEERTNIAIDSRVGISSQAELARATGLNPLTVHNIASGKTKGIDEERVTRIIGEVRDRALDRVMASLGLLTDDKLSGCSAKDLSAIASNCSRVVEKIQDKTEQPDNINFIIYSPELKQERAFNVIEV